MQKIDEPKEFETNNSQFPKWLIIILIIIAITIFKMVAKKEIRENAIEDIENTYDNEE